MSKKHDQVEHWDLGPLVGSSRRIITPGDGPFDPVVVANVFDRRHDYIVLAAPVMLEALQTAHPHVCSLLCPSVKKTDAEWTHSQECEQIRAAIDKATGGVRITTRGDADTWPSGNKENEQ